GGSRGGTPGGLPGGPGRCGIRGCRGIRVGCAAPCGAPAAKGTATRAAEGTARPPGISYTAWSGPGCPVPKGGGYREQNRDRDKGWFSVRTGGWTEKGCDGSFTSVPMSGDPGADARNRVVWWWSVGEAKRCDLAVYVPDDPESTHVGGHPTTYLVLSDPRDESSRYGRFEIDQTNTTSKTIRAGSFPVKGGRLAVMMLDRGENHWSDGTVPHHAASQIRITCRR
ncbi:adhesin, partial [Streptomyces clavuligerus]|uniref:adhesin n=1 Tax=Streptomyces clavuligerus TaxID=1901 RepID=UPI001E3779AE